MPLCVKASVLVVFAVLAERSRANFLARPHEIGSEKTGMSFDVRSRLMAEIEKLLGGDHRAFTEKRLARIEELLRPTFVSLPKNEYGGIEQAGASYALHRLFVKRHAWFIRALETAGNAHASWNTSSPTALLEASVPDAAHGFFEKRVLSKGFNLHDLAILAATFEHLVHKESVARLEVAYQVHSIKLDEVTSLEDTEKILDTYMAMYIIGFMLSNASLPTAKQAKELEQNAPDLYPTWNETKSFVRGVSASVAPSRDYFYYSDVANVITEIGERYGQYQSSECHELRDNLIAIEDTGASGAGRVRLSDFYNSALNEGMWQFTETMRYLRTLGALDETTPDVPKVIIANYVNGPSNCVASSAYYSVCCPDECEGLLAHLEQNIGAPEGKFEDILRIVAGLPSATMPADRELSVWLRERLMDVVRHHGGFVPLHGRLFAQWLHHAYPRECPFPHMAGTVDPKRPEDVDYDENVDAATDEEMEFHINRSAPRMLEIANKSAFEESAMWFMEEELVVCRPNVKPSLQAFGLSAICRGLIFLSAVLTATRGLVQAISQPSRTKPEARHASKAAEKVAV